MPMHIAKTSILQPENSCLAGFGMCKKSLRHYSPKKQPCGLKRKKMTPHKRLTPWLCLTLLIISAPACAENNLAIATAVNFINPMTEMTETFTSQHNIKTDVSYGSSGKLFAQMEHGAPYDIFLSADRKRPQILHEQGICGQPFSYAQGTIVLWSPTQITSSSWQKALQNSTGKIAIASPEAAPYGEKAYGALIEQNLAQRVKPQLIYGQSVGQTFLFAAKGGASFSFIALSQAISTDGKKGFYLPVPEAKPVEQWGCIATKAKSRDSAQEFKTFLLSAEGRHISMKYGYR